MQKRLQRVMTFDILPFKWPQDLRKTHVHFSGPLLKHPYDSERVILVADPHNGNTVYYEFRVDDISFLEQLSSTVDIGGRVIRFARLWVKKGSIGVMCTPFMVDVPGGRPETGKHSIRSDYL
jgi:inorganic pyrophosphatase